MGEKKNEVVDNTELVPVEVTEEFLREKLYEVRGVKVMLDADLAEIYGYETKRLNEQVKRNIRKFPEDFMFQVTDEEVKILWSQNATANINWYGLFFSVKTLIKKEFPALKNNKPLAMQVGHQPALALRHQYPQCYNKCGYQPHNITKEVKWIKILYHIQRGSVSTILYLHLNIDVKLYMET